MAETPNDLRQNIEAARTRITGDINELEYRIQRVTDWRAQYREHRPLILGSAFGFGLLIALLLGGRAT